jgi:hypothetical protein
MIESSIVIPVSFSFIFLWIGRQRDDLKKILI